MKSRENERLHRFLSKIGVGMGYIMLFIIRTTAFAIVMLILANLIKILLESLI